MSQKITVSYRGKLISKDFNDKIDTIIGGNKVVEGFTITPGIGKSITLSADTIGGTQKLFIQGALITEDANLTNTITIPDNTSGSVRNDLVYAKFDSDKDKVCTYGISVNTTTLSDPDHMCLIAQIAVPNGFSSASAITVLYQARFTPISNYSNSVIFATASGTGTSLVVPINEALVNGYSLTFIASANNNGAATTINSKPLYKPGTTTAPTLVAGKAYTVWYNLTGDCFFIKASADGTATVAQVLAGVSFSNQDEAGLLGTIPIALQYPNNGTANAFNVYSDKSSANGLHNVYMRPPIGYYDGDTWIGYNSPTLKASNLRTGIVVGDLSAGITGTYDSESAYPVTAERILAGYVGFVNGSKIIGVMPDHANTDVYSYDVLTSYGGEFGIACPVNGYLNQDTTIYIVDANFNPNNIRQGIVMFGLTGTMPASIINDFDFGLPII